MIIIVIIYDRGHDNPKRSEDCFDSSKLPTVGGGNPTVAMYAATAIAVSVGMKPSHESVQLLHVPQPVHDQS